MFPSFHITINGLDPMAFIRKFKAEKIEPSGSGPIHVDFSRVHTVKNKRTKISLNRITGKIIEDVKPVYRYHAHKLKEELVNNWPVATGRSRDGWRVQANQYDWTVVNSVVNPVTGEHYVEDLWDGLPRGSRQLPNGGMPILRRSAAMLQADLKKAFA